MKHEIHSSVFTRHAAVLFLLVGLASVPVAGRSGTMPLVGSDNQIPNGDFAGPILAPESIWTVESNGTGISNVFRLDSPGIPIDGTGSVSLYTEGAGAVGRLVSNCIPLNDPGTGFQYLLTARYRVATGTASDSSITIDRFSDFNCTQSTGSFIQSASAGLGDPVGGEWSLLRAGVNSAAIRITLTQTSSGSPTQAFWDDLQLRVPNEPEFLRSRLLGQGSFSGQSSDNNDRFGSVAAVGDFNNDGRDDAAFGVPLEDIGSDVDSGLVLVAYGAADGLSLIGTLALTPPVQAGQQAGAVLATGDFNCDGYDDLAIGAPGYTAPIVSTAGSGAVYIVNGSATGLDPSSLLRIERSSGTLSGSPATDDRFGAALSAGNFNRDEPPSGGSGFYCEDLAIGAPGVDIGSDDTGAVFLLFGSLSGLVTSFPDPDLRIWHQGRAGIGGAPEDGDAFGGALANYDRSHATGEVFADVLAISSPEDGFNGETGATVLLPGVRNSELMDAGSSQLLTPSDFNLPGQRFLGFGLALASGMDYDSQDLFPQFAVGAPFSDIPATLEPQTGLVVTYRPFTMDPPDVIEPPDRNTGGRFGQELVYADTLNRGIPGELWISEPGHSVNAPTLLLAAGQVIRLGRDLLTAGGLEFLDSEAFLADQLAATDLDADDEFGAMLVRGNFNGYGGDELLIGIPGWDIEFGLPRFNVGAVIEVSWDRDPVPPPDPDLLFADSFEGGGIILR